MDRVWFLLLMCSFTCLLIRPVELKFSEEYRLNSQEINEEIQQNNDADEQQKIETTNHTHETESDAEDAMQGDEPAQEQDAQTVNEQITQSTSISADPTETPRESLAASYSLNEDIPKVTSSTEASNIVEESASSFPTTEETNTEFIQTTEYTTETISSNDFENTVDDVLVKSTTETVSNADTSILSENENVTNTVSVNKLSDQIRLVLQQYKETGNVVVPNVKIPDPMPIPDMTKRMSMVTMNFMNQTVHGLSNFTVQHINTDLDKMQVYVMLHMKKLVVLGNYSMRSFISRASGPFNVTLIDVISEGAAALQYNSDGNLEASETNMDMTFSNIKLDFKNLGIMGSFFQGVLGAVGTLIFEGIKAPILTEVNTKMKDDVNVKIRAMSSGVKTNATISPVDQAILEGRRYIRNQGYDPYVIKNYTMNFAGLLKINLTELSMSGLSRFYRVGEVSLSMDNGTVEFGVHLAADNITGHCSWSAGFGRSKIRDGISSYVLDSIQGRAIIKQSLDLNKPPQVDDIDFRLGEVKLQTSREDALDIVAESVVNNLPLLLRHIIVDGIELPVKIQAQKILDQVDVKSIVENHLPKLDEMGV